MDEKAILDRFDRLEESIKSLQISEVASKSSEPRTTRLQRVSQFLLANWVLLSFLFAVATAVYVKFRYGVNYLHEYSSIKTKRELVDFHTRMGDILMGRAEWAAAEDAYRSAQQIDPESRAATLGIVKAQVFKPPAGEKYAVPEVVDAKLNYLQRLYPDDDQLLFLKGVRLHQQGKDKEAMASFAEAITKNKNSVGSYVNLGFIYVGQGNFDIKSAIENLERAVKADPDYSFARQNLGFLYVLSLDSEKALEHLTEACRISPRWGNVYVLGDAYRYSGDFAQAANVHKFALKRLTESLPENDPFLRESEVRINFMPFDRQNQGMIQSTVTVSSLADRKAVSHYALSFDYALMNDFDNANKELKEALRMDKDHYYSTYFDSTIDSIENLCPLEDAAKKWFESHRARIGGYQGDGRN